MQLIVRARHNVEDPAIHDRPTQDELDDEDRKDLADGLAALREFEESGEASIPASEVKKELGL